MKDKRPGILFPLFLMLLLLGSSCTKELDIDSTRVVNEKNMWNSLQDTRAALLGTYGLTRAALADHNAFWLHGELRMGSFESLRRQDMKAVIDNNLNAAYPFVEAASNWRRFYAIVNSANLFLERVQDVKDRDPRYSDQNMAVDIAQIRLLRAFAYFYMVRVWGDVPLITTSHDGQFENKPRDPQEDVLAFVEQELLAAARDLPYQYSQNDPQQAGNYYNEDAGRWAGALARKLSAYAILAHVSAWQGNYSDAARYAKIVLDNFTQSGHSYLNTNTLTNANGFFMGRQNNHLFALNFLFNHLEQSFTGHIEELTLARPVVSKLQPDIYIPKDTILKIFNEPLDERFSLDTLTGQPTSERYFAAYNTSVPIFSKIKVIRDGSADPTFRMYSSAIVFTRLEDIALLRAEALASLNDPAGAIELLNSIRGLRALPPFEEGQGDLIDAIFKERKRELLGEGWHWYDKVRYMKIKRNSPEFQELIDQGGIYWPVARTLLTQNPELEQTPYWK